ncbi:ABC transporter ATP-binding protein, partial [Vibrio natriegens]
QSILRQPTHPYTRLLISAVPDPDLPFANLVESEPNYALSADKIREISRVTANGVLKVGDNHFVSNWKGTTAA